MALSENFLKETEEAFAPVDASAKAGRVETVKQPVTEPVKTEAVKTEPAKTEPVKVEPVKVESDPDEEIISGKRSPKSEDFKRVKSKAAEFATKYETSEQERKRLEGELTTAKSRPAADPAEIETLRKELAASKEQFSTVALEFMPEFNAKYQARVDKVKGDLKGVAPDKADQLFDVLAMPNSKAKTERLAELTDDLDEPTKYEIYAANRELGQIQVERSGELKGSQDKLTAIVEGRKATAKQRQEALDATFDATVGELTKDNPLYQPREGDNDWNASVKERLATAKMIYSGQAEPKQVAKLAALGASHNILVATIQADKAKIKELETQVQSYQSTNPGVRGGGGSGGGKSTKSFSEQFEEGMKATV